MPIINVNVIMYFGCFVISGAKSTPPQWRINGPTAVQVH